MIEIRKVQMPSGRRVSMFLQSGERHVIDASRLMLFPALIDPHVHFRVPGAEHKETWETAATAAIAGGVTTVFDMPNNLPACSGRESFEEKKRLIDGQLASVGIPLRYYLYLGADEGHLEEIAGLSGEVIGLKIYMGSSTGDLLMHDPDALEKAFRLAAENDLLVAVHAEDEKLLQTRREQYAGETNPAFHSQIRSSQVAVQALEVALDLAKKYGTRLYVAHVSTVEEIALIRKAKYEGMPVYAEATPHHLFLTDEAYEKLGTKGLVNPPLRSKADVEGLWDAVRDGTIDTIGTDHAPHTLEEKMKPFGKAPSGFPSIELYFPLLLNAYHENKLTLAQIISLTHTRPQEIFRTPPNEDVVLVDLEKVQTVDGTRLHTKVKWSPYDGWTLKGWPEYTVLAGRLFNIKNL